MSKSGKLIWDALFGLLVVTGLINLARHVPPGPNANFASAICILIGLAGWVFGLWAWGFGKTRQEMAFDGSAWGLRMFYAAEQEFEEIDPANFDELDIGFYDETRAGLESKGFKFLGDVENVSASKLFNLSETFHRKMSGEGGVIVATLFNLRARGRQRPRDIRAIELQTELSDGTFIITNNQWKAMPFSSEPRCDLLKLPTTAPLDDLLILHRFRLGQALNINPQISATRVETVDDVIAFDKRLHEVQKDNYNARRTKVKTWQEQIALSIFEQRQTLYPALGREYRMASPGEFPNLNHGFYDRTQKEFETLGFRLLGDLEIVTHTRVAAGRRRFIRSMTSADGTVLMGAQNYQTDASGAACDIRSVELETEFSNGNYLSTSNVTAARSKQIFPRIEMNTLSSSASPAELLAAHAKRVSEILGANSGLTAKIINNMDECLDSQQRMADIFGRHMRDAGFFHDDELELLRQRKPRVRWQAVAIELQRLRKAELARTAAVPVPKLRDEP